MNSSRDKTRIAIHINMTVGEAGGVAQATQGLVQWLGRIEGPEHYLMVAQTKEQADWITPYCGSNQEVILRDAKSRRIATQPGSSPNARQQIKAMLRPAVGQIRSFMSRLIPQKEWPTVPISDGYYESLGCDVLHFPTQEFILCALPTIFNPHDLQHLHYPQFFDAWTLARRETIYPAACHFSNTVIVGSEWIKQDVIRQYGVHPEKVQIIPWAPTSEQYAPIDSTHVDKTRSKLALPAAFALYPAVTWPHKNHLRLLDAIAELRDQRGLIVNLVCTGSPFPSHWPKIEQRIKELNLQSQVRFLGFVSEGDLRALYRLAQFLVLPSLFEADSCPIHEAWSEGLPVASSNLTGLPDQVGEAGCLFDATQVAAIADALQKMTTDAAYRDRLKQRGFQRVKDFDWERTATAFRAVYRRAAGVTLTEEERWLLQWDWMREPGRSPLSQPCLDAFVRTNRRPAATTATAV